MTQVTQQEIDTILTTVEEKLGADAANAIRAWNRQNEHWRDLWLEEHPQSTWVRTAASYNVAD